VKKLLSYLELGKNWSIILILVIVSIVISSSALYIQAQESSPSVPQVIIPDEEKYEVSLQSRVFSPIPQVKLESLTAGLPSDEKIFFLMQFDEIPDSKKRAELKDQGIELLNYISGNTYIASTTVSMAVNVDAIEGLRFASGISSSDKVSLDLQEGLIGDWARVKLEDTTISEMVMGIEALPENLVVITIQFHKGVSIQQAEDLVKNLGGAIVGSAPIVPSVTAIVEFDKIQNISEQNIVQFIDQVDPPLQELNDGVRASANVDVVRNAPYGLTGRGSIVLVFDVGVVSDTHPDFGTRIIQSDPGAGGYIGGHATHVGGTVAGDGTNSVTFGGTPNQWAGMATQANLRTFGLSGTTDVLYDSGGDLNADFTTAINNGIDLATMSLGNNVVANGFPCNKLGDYTNTAILIDNIVRGSISGQQLIFFEAAGNERQRGAPCGQFSTIGSPATAKNSIVVGGINSNDNSLYVYTSFGPTDDGRLRPDITASGCQIGGDGGTKSTREISQNNYRVMCGTSMATPASAGIAALLIEQWRQTYTTTIPPLSHTMKAILIHTADDRGNTGPDYKFGWGTVNAQTAADLIIDSRSPNLIRIDNVDHGQAKRHEFNSAGNEDVKVTLVWDDPPATRLATTTLINDLNLVLRDPSGVDHRPFVLDPNNPNISATPGVDTINNVEMVIADAQAGKWEAFVLGTNVRLGPQEFSLVISENGGVLPCTFDVKDSTSRIDLSKYFGPTETRPITVQHSGGGPCTVNLKAEPADTSNFQASISPNAVSISSSNPQASATLTVTFIGNPNVASSVNVVGTSPSNMDTLTIPINGGCLIATATYGSPLAAEVQMLREFRDNTVLSTNIGTTFMEHFNEIYYTFSPTVAQWERDNPTFKEAVKLTITPLLATLSLSNYVNIDSEQEMIGFGLIISLMNIGMYFVAPAIIIVKIRNKLRKKS